MSSPDSPDEMRHRPTSTGGDVSGFGATGGKRDPYSTPKLTVYGDVVRLTETNATKNMSDMGSMTRT